MTWRFRDRTTHNVLSANAPRAVDSPYTRRGGRYSQTFAVPGTYPLRLDGRLDRGLSRWRWLVKWFLAIPHYAVLVLLIIGASVAIVIAWFVAMVLSFIGIGLLLMPVIWIVNLVFCYLLIFGNMGFPEMGIGGA